MSRCPDCRDDDNDGPGPCSCGRTGAVNPIRKRKRKILVKDVIAHLQTLPPDMEAWWMNSEYCEYYPYQDPPGQIETIEKDRKGFGTKHREIRWRKQFVENKKRVTKEVVVM